MRVVEEGKEISSKTEHISARNNVIQANERVTFHATFFSPEALARFHVTAINDVHLERSIHVGGSLKPASNEIKERNGRRLDSSISREKCVHWPRLAHRFLHAFFVTISCFLQM